MSEGDRQTWQRLAGSYDRVIPWFSSRYDAVRRQLRTDLAGVRSVLEVGAGTGQFTLDLAGVADRVVATDIAPEMTRRFEERVLRSGLTNVEVRTAGADALPFDDGAFDAVFCANVLHVMEAPRLALSEFARVTTPGGLLIAPTFCHGHTPVAHIVSRLLGVVSPFTAHTRFSAASLEAFVSSHGYAVEKTVNLGGILPVVYVRGRSRRES